MTAKVSFACLLTVLLGCASTTIKKNPGPHDHGFRFYRPKPYLFVKSAVVPKADKATPEFVSIELKWLPDFSEQYSLRARPGFGKNQTTATLEEGWKLTKLDYKLDSQTDENIKAVGGLIEKIAGLAMTADARKAGERYIVGKFPAHNVPLGFYEAVIDRDECGTKRLYGWRYIGFLPYAPCPVNPSGGQKHDCTAGEVYGLVDEGGIMVFKLLCDISRDEVRPVPVSGPRIPASKEALQAALDCLLGELNAAAKVGVSAGNFQEVVATATAAGAATIVVRVTKPADPQTVMKLTTAFQSLIRRQADLADVGVTVKVEVVKPPEGGPRIP
jgi:hypothetical protein